MTTSRRGRGKRGHARQGDRVRKLRAFTLPADVHAFLDARVAAGANISELVTEQIRAHPLYAAPPSDE